MSGEPQRPLTIGTAGTTKVSVSIPEDLVALVRERVGQREFSGYVTEALRRQVQLDLLGDLVDDHVGNHGEIPAELMEEAEDEWRAATAG